jgi:hypothetical protein
MLAPYFPIILIRGFAASDSNIEEATNQAFLGYEQGSTKTRQDASGAIQPWFFESVVVRLMKDHDYDPAYRDNMLGYQSRERVEAKSIWLHRYYDLASKTYDGGRLPIEDYAVDLRKLILNIRDKVCVDAAGNPDPVAFAAFKVHLVAHSQGGLVARSYLQKICRTPAYTNKPELKFAGGHDPLVASLFTYGTPHNGIEFLGHNVPDLGPLSVTQARNFNRKVIRDYLGLPKVAGDAPANDLAGALDPERTFCIVGTNWRDYDQPSKAVTGELSDGLVMCKNAYMVDTSTGVKRHSPRAFVSRAHGGPLGMVNSEEGYQNLRRFLFGDWRVDAEIRLEGICAPTNLVNALHDGDKAEGAYVLNVITSVRGQLVKLHERRAGTASGIRFPVSYTKPPGGGGDKLFALSDGQAGPDPQTTLCSLFMDSTLSTKASGQMEFGLLLALENPVFEVKKFLILTDHIEGLATLRESYRIRLNPQTGIVYSRVQDEALGQPQRPLSHDPGTVGGSPFDGFIPFGAKTNAELMPGEARGRILIRARRRTPLD